MRIVAGQINPIVGDVQGNMMKMMAVLDDWRDAQPDLFVFPELCITGYPPRDLLERSWLIRDTNAAIDDLIRKTKQMESGVIIGAPVLTQRKTGKGLFNAALLLHKGAILQIQHKRLLPTYDVFDEDRYFDPGDGHEIVEFKGEKIGITICEDAWNDPKLWRRPIYTHDPVEELATKGATLMINISASPYHVGKDRLRKRLVRNHARKHGVPFLFVNQVGGNDELIFDGRSLFMDATGTLKYELPAYRTSAVLIDTLSDGSGIYDEADEVSPGQDTADVYQALVLGLSDYVRKCRFECVLIGLSGGIDSALVATLAVEAFGPSNVTGITMPGPFSSPGSVIDSIRLAGNLGITCYEIGISEIYNCFIKTLDPYFQNTPFGVAEENIQARVRGNLLMAMSNKTGALVLTTGNKSELAVGYCTLYGDMSGGLSVLSDVPKTWVYRLASYANRDAVIIPRETIEKPPSAELRSDQKDQDTLPPYAVLDAILELYVDEGLSLLEITARGFETDTVRWVIQTVDRNEYKRRQAAPGLKVTSKAFGAGRRMPVAARNEI